MKTFSKGGVHPPENKLSASCKIEVLPLSDLVSIPVSQHIGAPAIPTVKKGDEVKVGQIIAKSAGFISANIHSSVSGVVQKIDEVVEGSGFKRKVIIIKREDDVWAEGLNTSADNFNLDSITAKEITDKVAESGIVGMGGATFPTNVKLMPPPGKTAEVLLINGVECEPFLTADHRLMLEKGEEMLVGIQILMKAIDVSRAVIGIENNKPDAIEYLQSIVAKYKGVEVCPLKVKYPQGGEKQLIKAAIGREVPSGTLPIEVGAVVQNVATAYAVYEAVVKNKPLIERVVTVTGEGVNKPSNFLARVGTPFSTLIDAAGGLTDNCGKVISGGPMMGRAIATIEIPVSKGSSGILCMLQEESSRGEASNCIRCAKCVSVCPMALEPYLISKLGKLSKFEELKEEQVMDCIECGSCSFECPANIPLLDYIRYGKGEVGKLLRSGKL